MRAKLRGESINFCMRRVSWTQYIASPKPCAPCAVGLRVDSAGCPTTQHMPRNRRRCRILNRSARARRTPSPFTAQAARHSPYRAHRDKSVPGFQRYAVLAALCHSHVKALQCRLPVPVPGLFEIDATAYAVFVYPCEIVLRIHIAVER